MADAERARAPGATGLAEAVARQLFRLMAIKDEYEVARLYTDGSFARQLNAAFEGDLRLEFHLAPPILGRRDTKGRPVKTSFGPWMMSAFRALAALKGLRGTPFDPFGYLAERKAERRALADYEALLDEMVAGLTRERHATAVALAALPEKIRGYGHVKAESLVKARAEQAKILEAWRNPPARRQAAE